jgi:hypothetical protein
LAHFHKVLAVIPNTSGEVAPQGNACIYEGPESVGVRQYFLMISEVLPILCEKGCQECVTISMKSRSTLLSFCQINLTITAPDFPNYPT